MLKTLNTNLRAGSIEMIADSYGLGKSTLRKAIREKRLRSTRCGRRVLIRIPDMERFLDQESKRQSARTSGR